MMKRKIWIVPFVIICFFQIGSSLAADFEFRVGPDDVLEISVWRDESLSRDVIVPPDGIISFPLIGDINVNNMTISELRAQVTKKLIEFIPDATVTVILKEMKSLRAYVIGKVQNAGEYTISLDTTVMQLLAKAGGLNPYASEDKIHIIRQTKGRTLKIPFDYGDIVKGRNLEQNIVLKRGDVIVVP
jgi:polysaccharide export outer membrane protein